MILIHGIFGYGVDKIDLRIFQGFDLLGNQGTMAVPIGMGVADDKGASERVLFYRLFFRFPNKSDGRLLFLI